MSPDDFTESKAAAATDNLAQSFRELSEASAHLALDLGVFAAELRAVKEATA